MFAPPNNIWFHVYVENGVFPFYLVEARTKILKVLTYTLAARGLEELFFQFCCCVSFSVLAGKRFWCFVLTRVQYSCGIVLVFWFWREIVFGVTYILRIQYSSAVMSVFGCGRK